MKSAGKYTFRQVFTAVCLHAAIWLGLLLFKFNRVRRWVYRMLKRERNNIPEFRPLVRAVIRSKRYIPGTSCLSEALCCYGLLLFNGLKPQLVIGVERNGNNKLDAHAWIELDGNVVLGDNGNLKKYEIMKDRKPHS